MAVTQVYNAVAGDTITAARWNNEFGNIYNNGTALAFPTTAAVVFAYGVTMNSTLTVSGDVTVSGAMTVSGAVTGGSLVGVTIPGYISGMTYQNSAGDATNDLDLASGTCADSTGLINITTSALTKRSDANWAVGTNQGALDTGAVGNNDYYIWAIKRVDTGISDYLYSLSSTAPTMPASYTAKRLIGWFKRVGGTVVAFLTYEGDGGSLEFAWKTPTLDVDLADTLTTMRRTDAIKVPLDFSVNANIRAMSYDVAQVTRILITCPDETDAAPSVVDAPSVNLRSDTVGINAATQLTVRTSSAGLVASRELALTADNFRIVTTGFTWSRR